MAARTAAQNIDTLIYRYQSVRSVGAGFPAVNYSLLSPLDYSGYSLNFHSTRFRETPKYLNQYRMYFELGLLYNGANDSYISLLGFNGGWSRHWYVTNPVHRASPLRLALGVVVDAGADVYMKEDNVNNPLAYFFNLSASPGILLKYRFNIQKTRFELGQQIDVPVVSLVSSSEYSVGLPHGFTEDEVSFFNALRWVSLGDFKKCATTTYLDVIPSLELRQKLPVFRISYMFSGMNYSNGDLTVKSAGHTILFGTIFHLFQ